MECANAQWITQRFGFTCQWSPVPKMSVLRVAAISAGRVFYDERKEWISQNYE